MNDGEECLQNNDTITLYMHIYEFFWVSKPTSLTRIRPANMNYSKSPCSAFDPFDNNFLTEIYFQKVLISKTAA